MPTSPPLPDSNRSRRPDALVIGGGLIGLAIAWRLAQRGLAVTVVDPAPGRAASWAAAGMLAPVTEVHYEEETLLGLNLESARRWASFAAELEDASGASVGYRPCGTLAVAVDAGDHAWLGDLHRFQVELGLMAHRLNSRECRGIEPALSPRIRGGVLVEGDHQVDPRRLSAALVEAARRAGVEFLAGTVKSLVMEAGGGIGAVVGTAGRTQGRGTESLTGGVVVLAAGAWSSALTGAAGFPPGLLPPIRPVKGQILRLRQRHGTPVINRNIRGLVEGSSVYLVPRSDGEVVVGATMEEQGFDTTVTTGAVMNLLRDAYGLVPEVSEFEFVEATASLRPCSPDNAPVIGPTGVTGLVMAGGHHRNGVLLTPVTADLVAELIATGSMPALGQPFDPARFGAVAR
ncbi:MAG: glycine oxidase ThiO [Acidimicrobiales bacterium]